MSFLPIIGAVISGIGSIAAGAAENRNQQYQADQDELRAKEEVAASQREAIAKRKEGVLANSRALAVAASSGAGAGADAPTIVKLMSDTSGEAEFNAQSVMYGGKERARGLYDSAKGRRAAGKASLLGGVIGGFGSALRGFG